MQRLEEMWPCDGSVTQGRVELQVKTEGMVRQSIVGLLGNLICILLYNARLL